MNDETCHSVTNYECYKGLYSSFNCMNMFEIGHSLARQFGPEQWTLYKGKHLLAFLDNHDVERIASILQNKEHLRPAYGLLFGMPGTPAVYYGSEWGIEGKRATAMPLCARPSSCLRKMSLPSGLPNWRWHTRQARLCATAVTAM